MAKKNKTSSPSLAGPSPVKTPVTSVVNPDAPSVDPGSAPLSSPSGDAQRERGAASESGDSRERIAVRAYERYLERGGGHGRETEDWLEAEKELFGHRDRDRP